MSILVAIPTGESFNRNFNFLGLCVIWMFRIGLIPKPINYS